MKSRLISVFLLAIAVMAFFVVPVAFAQEENVLLYGGNQDIDNIDPATGENYSINAALVSLYDALFIVRGENVEPNLVDTWDVSDDATVWTFNLKQNATFHDGSPVNAEAVVYSFNRLMTIQGPPTYRWAGIADADSAAAIDEFTVQFTLLQPFAPFLGTLTQLYVVNPAIVEANLGDDFGQTYLRTTAAGSGPFTQGRWEIGNLYEFVAVENYWGGWRSENHPSRVLWIIRRDSASQVNSLLANETHIADTIDLNDAARIAETPGYYVENNGGLFINSLKFNTQGEYTSDLNVRLAIAHAMNYEALPEVLDVPVALMSAFSAIPPVSAAAFRVSVRTTPVAVMVIGAFTEMLPSSWPALPVVIVTLLPLLSACSMVRLPICASAPGPPGANCPPVSVPPVPSTISTL